MLIDLSELLSVNDKVSDVQAFIEMSRFTSKICNYKIVNKEPLQIHLQNMGKKVITLDTVINVTLAIPCDRCLEEVEYPLSIKVNKEINMNESDQDRMESLDEITYIQDTNLDVEILVYNEILVHLPMKVLCSENCKGICNRCGANLNSQTCNCDTIELDPRMSKIRDVFNNFKEV